VYLTDDVIDAVVRRVRGDVPANPPDGGQTGGIHIGVVDAMPGQTLALRMRFALDDPDLFVWRDWSERTALRLAWLVSRSARGRALHTVIGVVRDADGRLFPHGLPVAAPDDLRALLVHIGRPGKYTIVKHELDEGIPGLRTLIEIRGVVEPGTVNGRRRIGRSRTVATDAERLFALMDSIVGAD
jgi:hypothetical protein